MEKLIIQIGASKDFFDGFAINCEGVYGGGETLEACKDNILEGLHLLQQSRPKSDWPEILKGDYQIEL